MSGGGVASPQMDVQRILTVADVRLLLHRTFPAVFRLLVVAHMLLFPELRKLGLGSIP